MTAESHYLAVGHNEGLNPNVYFNETEYLNAKLAQLQEDGASGWGGKDINQLRDFIASAGMTAMQHYEAYGAFETRADGTLLNPSNGFDANAYMQAKLVQMQQADPSTTLTVQDVLNVFQNQGLSPLSHAVAYGQAESDQSNVDMIQTVPDAQRVAADPARAAINAIVPGNSAEPTLAPSAVTTPREAVSPFDMDDVALPTPQTVAPAPAPDPTPDPTPEPTPDPSPAPAPGPGYKYNDLITIRHDGDTLYFDVNEDSQAYGLLFNNLFSGENSTKVYNVSWVKIDIKPNLTSGVLDGSSVRYTQSDVTYSVLTGAGVTLMVDQQITVPAGTSIDINALPGNGWNWSSYSVMNYGSYLSGYAETIVSGPNVTVKLTGKSGGSGVLFDSDNNWQTSGVVEVLSNTGPQAQLAFASDDAFVLDGTADDDMSVDLVGVTLPSYDGALA